MGPFIGWKSVTSPVPLMGDDPKPATLAFRMLRGLVVTSPSGSPRSQESWSLSAKMWQDEHDASPFAEVALAS